MVPARSWPRRQNEPICFLLLTVVPLLCLLTCFANIGCSPRGSPLLPYSPRAGSGQRKATGGGDPEGPVTLLLSAEIQGYTEPCGCTKDLQEGGIGRLATLVRRDRDRASFFVLLDGGDLLTGESPIPGGRLAQEQARMEVLLETAGLLGYDALSPGGLDLSFGLDKVLRASSRYGIDLLSSNLRRSNGETFGPSRLLLRAGPLRIGVLAYTEIEPLDRASSGSVGVRVEPVTEEGLARDVASLRQQGATQVLVLGHLSRRKARRLLERVPGINFWLVACQSRDTDTVERVGEAYLLEVWTQARRVGRLDLYPRAGAAAAALKPCRSEQDSGKGRILRRRIAYIERRIATIGPGSLRQAQMELLEQTRRDLASHESAPAPGSPGSFCWQLLSLSPDLPPEEDIEALRIEFNRRLRSINLSQAVEIPEPGPGESGFLGANACGECHEEALRHWQSTPHATALARLQERGKEFDDECVGCHVTGYREPGGSAPGRIGPLANVGCESCHGPASRHAKLPTAAEPLVAKVPEPRCLRCHVPEHSPRFSYDAYLPGVLGPGHGSPSG